MRHSKPLPRPDSGRRAGSALPRLLRRSALLLGAVLVLGTLTVPAFAQGNRPDQVMWRNNRGAVKSDSGVVLENTLAKTVIETSTGTKDRKSNVVERVIFGDVPTAFADGDAYFDRGDYENAAAKYKLAAGDANTRNVVRAFARRRAAEALSRRGRVDAGAFALAKAEAETFLSDHPNNRDVPRVRMLNARVTRLAGDDKAAADLYRALFMEAAGGTPKEGYSIVGCYQAGLAAAEAFLAAGESTQAQEIYGTMNSSLPDILAQLDADSPHRNALLGIQSMSQLGEGYLLLANDKASQAKNFFESQIRNADINDPNLVYGAHLGLAETLLAEGNHREAQLEFAFVSALDHASRDRVARALVGMAVCADKLLYSTSRAEAKVWLEDVRDHYGDTPSVLRAQEMLQGR